MLLRRTGQEKYRDYFFAAGQWCRMHPERNPNCPIKQKNSSGIFGFYFHGFGDVLSQSVISYSTGWKNPVMNPMGCGKTDETRQQTMGERRGIPWEWR